MTTHLGSQSEAFTGMTELHGSLISMQFLSYLKELTPLCEHKPEMIFLARIRLEPSKQKSCLHSHASLSDGQATIQPLILTGGYQHMWRLGLL
jgi:hypothetical protein